MAAKDISEELYANIKKSFDAKYEKAQLLGEPLHDVAARIQSGAATFRDADMYAVEVGSMLSDALKENLILEKMPNKTFYRNIAQKTLGTSLKDSYGLVSTAASVAQEEMNAAAGIGLKVVKPKLDTKLVDANVDRASGSTTQEALNAALDEPVKTFTRKVVDDTKKANARLHNKAGLEVKVEREYDGVGLHEGTDACDWCIQRAGTWTYDKAMANGVFERHEGCGCIIDYTSKKGEVTRSTGKYSGFKKIDDPEERERKLQAVAETARPIRKIGVGIKPSYGERAIFVNKEYIESQEYRMQFHGITGDPSADDKVYEQAKKILYERSGTYKETMVVMDAKTGSPILEIHEQKDANGIHYSAADLLAIHDARDKGMKLIALHNHPEGFPPTADDAVSALLRGYDMGIACGHNGIVYTYPPAAEYYDTKNCQDIHDLINKQYLEGMDIDKFWNSMLNIFGISYKRIK